MKAVKVKITSMTNPNKDPKSLFTQKFLEFQLMGLKQYHLYLEQQLKLSETMNYAEAYRKYNEKEIARNGKKIAEVEEKLKGY